MSSVFETLDTLDASIGQVPHGATVVGISAPSIRTRFSGSMRMALTALRSSTECQIAG